MLVVWTNQKSFGCRVFVYGINSATKNTKNTKNTQRGTKRNEEITRKKDVFLHFVFVF